MSNPTFKILTKTAFGLEKILAEEIEQLGGQDIEILNRAVLCQGDKKLIYRINYESRVALRVLKFISEFTVFNEQQLYKGISKIQWDNIFKVSDTFAIDSVVNSDRFQHSKYVALKSKDAIVDQFRKKYEERPSIDTTYPDFRIMVHIRDTTCGVFLDSSGFSLHKRGYRLREAQAPLSECLAAGMIKLTGWNGEGTFMDPMCGSGTLLVEAAMMALQIPAGKYREAYAFQHWDDYDEELFYTIKSDALAKVSKDKEGLTILGSDKSEMVLRSTKQLINRLGLEDYIQLETKPFDHIKNELPEGIIITNPPYDKRIKAEDIDKLYSDFGDVLKKQFTGWSAWVISANKEALKKVGLSASKKLTLYNGPDECKFQRYDMYSGSKKKKYQTEEK